MHNKNHQVSQTNIIRFLLKCGALLFSGLFFLVVAPYFSQNNRFAASVTRAAITYNSAGAIAYSASGGTSVTPAYPASIVASDMLILIVGMKPSVANGGLVTTPSGWSLVTSLTGAGGYGTTLGADTGNTNIFVYSKVAAGTESGSLTVTIVTNGVSWGQIYRLSNDSDSWSVAGSTGSDTSAGSVSIATSAGPGVRGGDFIIGGMVIPTDVSTPNQFSAEAITQTGITFGAVTEISEPDSTTGNDIGGFTFRAPVSSGLSSAAPTFTATAGGTTTNVRGPGVFIRIRELITISGTCDAFDQTTDCGDTGTVTVAVNGIVQTETQATVAGNWSIANFPAPVSGASIIVFINGAADADEASAVTKYDGSGNIDNLILYKEHVTIGTSGGANADQTIALANMDDYDATNDEDVFYDIMSAATCNGVGSFTGLCVDGSATSSQEELYIATGDTFAPSGNVLSNNVEIVGTWTGGAHTYTIQGSWLDTGTFAPSTSTVTFTSTTSGKTITTTGSAFNNLTFNGTNGTWTLQDGATVSGVLTITAGEFNAGSGTTLTLSGNGAPFAPLGGSGTFNPNTGTVDFSSTATTGTTVPRLTYYNLTVNKASNIFTAEGGGTLSIGGNLNITAGTLTFTTNDPNVDVDGNVIIDDVLVASNSGTFTIGGNWTNNAGAGGFTHSSATVVFDSSTTSVITGTTTFNNVTVTTAGKTLQFGAAITFTFAGTFTVTGTPNSPIYIQSTSNGSQWLVTFNIAQSAIAWVHLRDSGCSGGQSVSNTHTIFDQGNNGACWLIISRGGSVNGGDDGNTGNSGTGGSGGGPTEGGSASGGDGGSGGSGIGGGGAGNNGQNEPP